MVSLDLGSAKRAHGADATPFLAVWIKTWIKDPNLSWDSGVQFITEYSQFLLFSKNSFLLHTSHPNSSALSRVTSLWKRLSYQQDLCRNRKTIFPVLRLSGDRINTQSGLLRIWGTKKVVFKDFVCYSQKRCQIVIVGKMSTSLHILILVL